MFEELILSPAEEEMRGSHFRDLLPGQIDYPIGPLDPKLPFPIYFRLLLERRRIVRAYAEIGWQHAGVEKLLETANPAEAIELIREVNPLAPNWMEHVYRQSIGLDPINADILREEKRQYHLYFIRRILEHLEEDRLVSLSHKNLENFRAKFLSLGRLQKRLSGVGRIGLKEAISFGFTGPSLSACREPYFGDVWSRLVIKMEEIRNPTTDLAPEGLLMVTVTPARARIRTPSFVHAAALGSILPGNELDDLVLILLSFGIVGSEMDR